MDIEIGIISVNGQKKKGKLKFEVKNHIWRELNYKSKKKITDVEKNIDIL